MGIWLISIEPCLFIVATLILQHITILPNLFAEKFPITGHLAAKGARDRLFFDLIFLLYNQIYLCYAFIEPSPSSL
jgi:hypothetical protein